MIGIQVLAVLLTMEWIAQAPTDSKPAKAAQAKTAPTAPTGVRTITPTLAYDIDKRQVILDAVVVLREGPLELFLCPKRTKEHESILAAEVQPRNFQLALLMIGAQPGRPAEFEPFKPPTGQKLKIWVEFERDGKQERVDARTWIRGINNKKALDEDFVFAGSRFTKLPGVDRAIWMGDDGDLICVSNFPGSVVDIGAKSSKENQDRLFEAWTERIPPRVRQGPRHFRTVK